MNRPCHTERSTNWHSNCPSNLERPHIRNKSRSKGSQESEIFVIKCVLDRLGGRVSLHLSCHNQNGLECRAVFWFEKQDVDYKYAINVCLPGHLSVPRSPSLSWCLQARTWLWCFKYRGDVVSMDVHAAMTTIKKQRTSHVVDRSPTGFECARFHWLTDASDDAPSRKET